jgi:alkylated DNA repair dioxygenase AlkB
MTSTQGSFDFARALPGGLVYRPDVLAPDTERAIIARLPDLPFRHFEFHGFQGLRRTVSFGAHYDFAREALAAAPPIPDFLEPCREAAATLAGLPVADLSHLLVTEYPAGAAIGWHRDKGVYETVIGISLLAPCTFRLRRRRGSKWERASFVAEPRSGYVLAGEARTVWEHSIPAVPSLRYSLTFRSLRR